MKYDRGLAGLRKRAGVPLLVGFVGRAARASPYWPAPDTALGAWTSQNLPPLGTHAEQHPQDPLPSYGRGVKRCPPDRLCIPHGIGLRWSWLGHDQEIRFRAKALEILVLLRLGC